MFSYTDKKKHKHTKRINIITANVSKLKLLKNKIVKKDLNGDPTSPVRVGKNFIFYLIKKTFYFSKKILYTMCFCKFYPLMDVLQKELHGSNIHIKNLSFKFIQYGYTYWVQTMKFITVVCWRTVIFQINVIIYTEQC